MTEAQQPDRRTTVLDGALPTGVTIALAVVEDDTVLCVDCLDELRAEQVCETAATIVHAWLADPASQSCRCCGATDDSEMG